ncbi:EAL domain-containing protein [Aeromicrobium fastidiosum]|uniref:bifunctional diguanylate cyclase/phosphodiesterase n=1 Tax=Aeromicrobium fastidiosum TaxID=52699 RepID=UPI0020234BA7|nr:EAL domain-containing protein [Aeromicrobium fastidiosum]MCL8253079.1 EAL domain-containing protein [Aeromicrobium fastidiosum]
MGTAATAQPDTLPWRFRHPAVVPVSLALMGLLLLLVVGYRADRRSTDQVMTAAQERVRSNRDAAVRALVRQTDDYLRAVEALAEAPPVGDYLTTRGTAAPRRVVDDLASLARSQDSPAVFLTDASGSTRASYPEQPEQVGRNFAFRDWYQGASSSGRPYVSEGFRSAAVGRPYVVAVAAPVSRGGRRVGYVAFLWELESVRLISEGAKADDGISIVVTDQRGQALVSSLEVDPRGQGTPGEISPETAAALAGRSSSSTTDEALVETGPVPPIGWTVTASLPKDDAALPAVASRRTLERAFAVASLLVLVATALMYSTARRRAGEAAAAAHERRLLLDSEERFRRVFDEGLTGKFIVAPSGEILRANATMGTMLGRPPERLVHTSIVDWFVDDEDRATVAAVLEGRAEGARTEMRMHSGDDTAPLWGLVAMAWIEEQAGSRVVLVQVEDVTGRREAEQQLTMMALHDELTGLPNRRLLLERCEHAVELARSGRTDDTWVSVLFIDLDGFKTVNDRAGHDAGDQVLIGVARDLREVLRPTDTLARIGGDEFVVLLETDDGQEDLFRLAQRLVDAVRRTVPDDELGIVVSASVGIARLDVLAEPDVRPDQLIDRADAAMYRAKQRGKDRHDIFDEHLHDITEARRSLEQAVREGLHDDRIALVFQPVVDVDTGVVCGAEALLRLLDASGSPLPTLPAVVAAESAGLAEVLSDRVLDLALATAHGWPETMSVAVNVSARELASRGLRGRVVAALAEHGVASSRLVIEVTETSILNAGRSVLEELELLRQAGVRIAIDDFGTAYATLKSLTTLPVDILKVDASFTAGLPDQRAHSAVVHGVASMAAELGIPCIVEGVETERQRDAIRGLGLQAQGWWWGLPRGPETVPAIADRPADDTHEGAVR